MTSVEVMPELERRLHVARIPFPDGRERHVLVRLEPVNEAAAYEYHDPVSDQVVGSVGRNRLAEFVDTLEDFINRYKQGDNMQYAAVVTQGLVMDTRVVLVSEDLAEVQAAASAAAAKLQPEGEAEAYSGEAVEVKAA